ncbi:MAG: ABC transporter substrate-binding protein [Ruminococcaceae bacterium]|nr:ABC transporter substrate-binding protein [Oscillospiraceae bacterium]
MARKKISALALVLVMVLGIFLTGCSGGGSSSTPTSTGGASASTPADNSTDSTGGDTGTPVNKKDSIVVAVQYNINKLDPQYPAAQWEWQANMCIYDSLFHPPAFDYENLENALCESYEISDDMLEYTFHLRQGVKFHDGSDFTAEDVVFTIERAMASPYVGPNLLAFDTVTAEDDHTVKLVQKYTSPDTLKVLAEHYLGIVSKAAVTEYGDGAVEAVVGTGPYKLVSWTQDAVELDTFEDYYGELPEIKAVTYRPITDYTSAAIAMNSGEIDVLNYANPSDEQGFIEDDNFDTVVFVRDHSFGVTMNNQLAPFNDINVRRAINHAIDRESLNMIVTDGYYDISAYVKSTPRALGYEKADSEGRITKYEYDLEKAKALLAEAGFDENNPLNCTYITPNTNLAQTLASAVQAALASANINLNIEVMEAASWLDRISTGDFEMSYNDCGFANHRASLSYYFQFHSGTFYNRENTQLARVDELTELGMAEMDEATREEYYAELIEIVTDEAINMPGIRFRGVTITTKGLVVPNDMMVGITSIKDAYWK